MTIVLIDDEFIRGKAPTATAEALEQITYNIVEAELQMRSILQKHISMNTRRMNISTFLVDEYKVGEDPETRMKGQEGHLRVQPVGAIAGESQAVAIYRSGVCVDMKE
uniref:Uncharacterized protein n=1 Tax=Oryza punctata TaxID=4537 RepID=A0A0E0KLZ1_ORYPU